MTATTGWRLERHGNPLEGNVTDVFISPDGRWWRVAGKGDPVDLERPSKHGLAPVKLTNIDHWRPTE